MPSPGYLITLFESGAYLGGVLITNERGYPVDFRYSDPVVPGEAERILYGPTMEDYIRNEVLIGTLAAEIANQPPFYVVPSHQLFEIAEVNDLPLIALQRTQLAPLGEKGVVHRAKDNECLVQGWTDQYPIRVVFGQMPVEQQETVLKDLAYLTKTMDVVEPLERLEKLVQHLWQAKRRKSAD